MKSASAITKRLLRYIPPESLSISTVLSVTGLLAVLVAMSVLALVLGIRAHSRVSEEALADVRYIITTCSICFIVIGILTVRILGRILTQPLNELMGALR